MAQVGPFLGGVPVTSRDIPGKSIDTGHLRNLPVYALATIFFKETNRSLMTAPGVNDPSPATCFFCKYNDVNVLYVTIGKIASSGVLVERLVGLGFLSSVLSYGRGIRKGTQGSVLAWRTASLLLIRLLFVLKPPL